MADTARLVVPAAVPQQPPQATHGDVPAGPISDTGAGPGLGTTINIPLPPGSGSGAYRWGQLTGGLTTNNESSGFHPTFDR
jgi:hypothetical protein